MANTNMTREDRLMQKKSECFFAAELVEGTESYNIGVVSANYLLANIPPNSIITNAYIHVETVSDAATTNVATLGTTEGGSEIVSAGDLKTAVGKTGTFTGQSLTGTGKGLYLGLTVTGAATAVGEYIVVVEYMEYRKNTGEYTKVTNI